MNILGLISQLIGIKTLRLTQTNKTTKQGPKTIQIKIQQNKTSSTRGLNCTKTEQIHASSASYQPIHQTKNQIYYHFWNFMNLHNSCKIFRNTSNFYPAIISI